MLGNVHKLLRRKLQHEGHDADVDSKPLQGLHCLGITQGFELKNLQPMLQGRSLERVRLATFLFRCTEHTRHLIATRQKSLQHSLAKILLPNNRDTHDLLPNGFLTDQRCQLAFFGGKLKAPAVRSAATLDSS